MKYKLIVFSVFIALSWWLKSLFWPVSLNGSVNTNVIRHAMKNCMFDFSACTSRLMLKDMTDFEWDSAYLFPINFFNGGYIYTDDIFPQKIYTTDLLQLSFFLNGKNVHFERFSYGSPGWFPLININAGVVANQMIFFDRYYENPFNELGSINVNQSNHYFKCGRESSLRVLKFIPAKDQWPRRLVLVVPEGCETKLANQK